MEEPHRGQAGHEESISSYQAGSSSSGGSQGDEATTTNDSSQPVNIHNDNEGPSSRRISYPAAGNEKTPARSFYHRSFHGALGKYSFFLFNCLSVDTIY